MKKLPFYQLIYVVILINVIVFTMECAMEKIKFYLESKCEFLEKPYKKIYKKVKIFLK